MVLRNPCTGFFYQENVICGNVLPATAECAEYVLSELKQYVQNNRKEQISYTWIGLFAVLESLNISVTEFLSQDAQQSVSKVLHSLQLAHCYIPNGILVPQSLSIKDPVLHMTVSVSLQAIQADVSCRSVSTSTQLF